MAVYPFICSRSSLLFSVAVALGSAIKGFRWAVLKGDCAVARDNQNIHRSNAATAGVYVLRKDALFVKLR